MSTIKAEPTNQVGNVSPTVEFNTAPQGLGDRGDALSNVEIPPDAIRALPADFVKRHQVLPLAVKNGTLHIATANPGCMLQLQAGVRLHGHEQRVMHVLELLDLAYKNFTMS